MKNIYVMMCILLFVGCTTEEPTVQYTTVLIDTTESNGYKPSAEELQKEAILKQKIDSKYFSIQVINDLGHNIKRGVFISPAETGVFYDELTRNMVVDDYYQKVDSLLLNLDSLKFGTNHSQIFRAVLGEARFLMEHKAERKLIIYSDLQENSSAFSVRNSSHKKLLKNLDQMVLHFEEQFDLKKDESFKGLSIQIHHVPTSDTEQSFDVFLAMYTLIFESRGASVSHELSIIENIEL
jgi:hypothetical protein